MNDYIKPEEAVTLHGLFLDRAKRTPDKVAYRYFDLGHQVWRDLTWGQMREQVARWKSALSRENFQPGDRVALMLRNCPQWVMFDQAAQSLGLVTVPLYVVDRAENVAYIIKDAGARLLVFETAEQWKELSTVAGQLDGVQRFVSIDDVTDPAEPRLQSTKTWLPASAEMGAERPRDGSELVTIMYTSGTSGKPKGVMLSQRNQVYNAHYALKAFAIPMGSDDVALSFLPLSHTFERTAGYHMMMMAGVVIAYARSVALLGEDFQIIHPTILSSVPRIYERIYGAIQQTLEQSPPLRRKLFEKAIDIGWARFEYQQGRGPWQAKLLLWPLFEKLVAGKVMERLGGRLRIAASGGAAIPTHVARLFISLGLRLLQGYGMTETSPVISVNRINANRPETVGQVLEDVEVKLGDQNAVLVRGHGNMMGYWNNPEATRAMIDKDGWLNTGDTASIDKDGYITINGRIKEIIVMSNGEKVPPGDMEEAILRDRLFDQVMVYGEARSTLIVLGVVNQDHWRVLAQHVGVRPDLPESLSDARVEREVLERVDAQIKSFPGYAKIKRALLLTEPWGIENGMLTPTLKLKRAQVSKRYMNEIDRLYDEKQDDRTRTFR
jgi:long-chain acyl-CoA synthetase